MQLLRAIFKSKIVRLGLAAGLISFYVILNPDILSVSSKFTFWYVLAGMVFTALNILVNGYFLKLVIDKLASRMSLPESYYISFLTSFANLFLPMRSGALIRARYLKKRYGFSYKNFISMLYGNYVLIFAVSSSLALISIKLLDVRAAQAISLIVVMAIVLLISLSMLSSSKKFNLVDAIVHYAKRLKWLHPFMEKVERVMSGWTQMRNDKSLLYKLVGLVFVSIVLRVTFFAITLRPLGVDAAIPALVLMTALTTFSNFIAITPGSLGIREGVLIVFSETITIGSSEILSVSLLDRLTSIVMLGLLGIIFIIFNKGRGEDIDAKHPND